MQTRGRDYDQRTSASELVIAIVIQNTVHLALECEVCEGGGGWWKAMPNGAKGGNESRSFCVDMLYGQPLFAQY